GGRGVFHDFWPGVQVAGKDNLRQQTAMWQAMLMSAGIPNSKQVFIHGFVTAGGQKMSKSLGNVVDPVEIVEKYGVDATRYYLLGALPSYDDGDFTIEKFEEFYTAHLVNGVGNLTSRILTMIEKEQGVRSKEKDYLSLEGGEYGFWDSYVQAMTDYDFQKVVSLVNDFVKQLDTKISDEKPWEKAKNGEDIKPLLYQLAEGLRHIGLALLPIIPASAEKILTRLGYTQEQINSLNLNVEKEWGRLASGTKIVKGEILFPRLEK
ncbi:MAG: class I tRNA ligase family protein, partial [Candidatus Magasanikbacteria bacterium]|nr:class I tRNA ligase family protein [Candidatus Magasanikbacteria bacterium]